MSLKPAEKLSLPSKDRISVAHDPWAAAKTKTSTSPPHTARSKRLHWTGRLTYGHPETSETSPPATWQKPTGREHGGKRDGAGGISAEKNCPVLSRARPLDSNPLTPRFESTGRSEMKQEKSARTNFVPFYHVQAL